MNKTARRCLATGCMVVAAVAFSGGGARAGTASQPSAMQKAAPAQIQQVPTTVTPPVAPSTGETIYLTIPGISGDGPGGKIVCHSFRRGQAAPRDAAKGQASGKVRVHEIVVTKKIDAASPMLLHAKEGRRPFDSAVIEFYRAQPDVKSAGKASKTKEVKYLVIKLTDVIVTSVRQAGGGDFPTEAITFVYTTEQLKYE